jgi:hypothetical protein
MGLPEPILMSVGLLKEYQMSKSNRKTRSAAASRSNTRSERSRVVPDKAKLYPTKACENGNPRRPGSLGRKSMAIILRKPGLTVAEFLEAKGRRGDLNWDIRHGHVTTNPRAALPSRSR